MLAALGLAKSLAPTVAIWLLLTLASLLSGCGNPPETEVLLTRLRSGNTAERLRAVSEAETRNDRRVRSQLLKMVESPKELPLVRGAAALALGRLHDERLPAAVVRRLPDAILGSAKPGAVQTEAFILGKALTAYGPESLDALGALLRHPREEVVCWTIGQHGMFRRNDRALAVLEKYLAAKDPQQRRSAAYGLAQTFHPRAEAIAAKALGDADAEVRYHVAWALANTGSAGSLKVIDARLAKDPDTKVRTELSRAATEIRAREAIANTVRK